MLPHIQHSVIAYLDLEVMHLLDVHQFHLNVPQSIHVSHHHAVKIHNVLLKTVSLDVLAFHHTSVMLTAAAADQNVFTIQIVPADWLVYVNIVEIHAQAYAVIILSAMSSIMYQFALAPETIKEIHSRDADHSYVYVSI